MAEKDNINNKTDNEIPKGDQNTDLVKIIIDNWGGIAKVLVIIGTLLGAGYYVGYKVSSIEHSSKINSLMNEKDKEIMDIRERYMDKRMEKIEAAGASSNKIAPQDEKGGNNEK